MKSFIAGACVAIAINAVDIALHLNMSFGARMAIICSLAILAGLMIEERGAGL